MIPILYLLAQISCLFLIILFAVFYLWANTFGVPFVPSDRRIVNNMVNFLKKTKVKKVADKKGRKSPADPTPMIHKKHRVIRFVVSKALRQAIK